ncbi:MAG: restriction endonuclease subunit S [Zoogloeaceae bacterium]|jgi:type I restriction enzyme S subunit|nr:restriction endonuclease subunit S [Zoogloeaceae bacterium]
MKAWPKVALGDICAPAERYTTPTPGKIYRQLGVRLWGEGAYEREKIDGAATKYANFNCIAVDDLVVNKIWARNGAVAVVTQEQSGTYVSTEFPAFVLDYKRIDPRWMRLVTKWQGFWSACDEKARGTSGKNRIKPKQFLSIEIPLPPLPEQQALVARFDALAEKTRQVEAHLDAAERNAEHLLVLRFHEAIADAPLRPMAEVAPLMRREVSIDSETNYTELGVRSFYKGTFHRRTVPGTEFSWQNLYHIKAGDLVFSNIMAWEQAIALAKSEDDGCVGNHRMLTCEAKADCVVPGFLRYYFTTPEGFEQIYAVSPGTAARNRTMTAPALMAIEVPVPPLTVQQSFDRLQTGVAALKAQHAAIRTANATLLPAMLERVFS